MCSTGVLKTDDPKKSQFEAEQLELPPVMKFFTFYYFFRMTLLDISYLTLGDLPALQILIPLTIEGIFVVIVLISAKLTNVFGSKFVVFRLALQGTAIFFWLMMAYLGTLKSEKYDYRGFRESEYAEAIPDGLSVVLEWTTVFLIMLMLFTEVFWSCKKLYGIVKSKIKDQMDKVKRNKERKVRHTQIKSVKKALYDEPEGDEYFAIGK